MPGNFHNLFERVLQGDRKFISRYRVFREFSFEAARLDI
jgi:hypothetical protein